jgi:hypothetical protein
MLEFPRATLPFIQFPAPPIEINATTGITTLLFEHMIHGDPVFKSSMGLLNTFEYILSFVVINPGLNDLGILGQ